jgi:LCP family protein required for cell wall assembly
MRNQQRKKPAGLVVLGAILYLAYLIFFLAVGAVGGWAMSSKMLAAILGQRLHPVAPQAIFHDDSITLLILGCDEDRYYRGTYANGSNIRRKYARADMIMVAKLDFKNNRVTGVTVPRDTLCSLPGYGARKINAYHSIAKKGQEDELEKAAVEAILPGVTIDRVITLDYDAFRNMVDAVGGVPVTIDKRMKYDDNAGNVHVNFYPGPKTLNGYDAEMFVRFRHSDDDLHRQDRQRQFLLAFKNAVISHPFALPRVADTAVAVLNRKLTEDEIAALMTFAQHVPQANIQLGQIPVREGRGSTLVVDTDKLDVALAHYGLKDNYQSRVSYSQ